MALHHTHFSRRFSGLARVVVGALVAGLLSMPGGSAQEPVRAGEKTETPAPAAQTPESRAKDDSYVVAAADIARSLLFTGELLASQSRELTVPRIQSGFSSSVTFLELEGTEVKQGQRILEFDGSALISQKSEAERRLDEAKLRIEKTKADLEAQRCDFLSEVAQTEGNLEVAKLYARIAPELLPANTYQRYQLDLEKAQLALTKARERLANHEAAIPAQLALADIDRSQAELDLKKIEGDLKLLSVDAPQDGIIIYGDNWASNRKVQIGDNVFPGTTVIILPDLATMHVEAYVYDTEMLLVSRGMVCELSLDAVPGRTFKGNIVSLTSIAGRKGFASKHKVFKAVIRPDSVDTTLMKPGMTVRVAVPVSMTSQVPAVPRDYLGLDDKGQYFVLKGADLKTASVQTVTPGAFGDELVQIASGLDVGDRVFPVNRKEKAVQ